MNDKKDTGYETNGDSTNPEREYFAFLIKRAEKLASALYMVTGFVSDMEPIKWTLRERSVTLLSDMAVAEHASLSDRIDLFDIAMQATMEIESLVAIARSGRIISDMNAEIISNGYNALKEAIGRGTGIPTSADMFVSELLKDDEKTLPEGKEANKGQTASDVVLYNSQNQNRSMGHIYKSHTQQGKGLLQKRIHAHTVSHEGKTERRMAIIDFIKKKKEVTIKDVLSVVSGCSEKTIQRELISLVKDNVLKKEGERRWSRYSLR